MPAKLTLTANFGTVTKLLLSSIPGKLDAIVFINRNAAVRFGQLHDKATAPAATNVPVLSLPIPAGTANNPGVLSISRTVLQDFTVGIGWSISTAESVFTDAATASEHTVHAWYA